MSGHPMEYSFLMMSAWGIPVAGFGDGASMNSPNS